MSTAMKKYEQCNNDIDDEGTRQHKTRQDVIREAGNENLHSGRGSAEENTENAQRNSQWKRGSDKNKDDVEQMIMAQESRVHSIYTINTLWHIIYGCEQKYSSSWMSLHVK